MARPTDTLDLRCLPHSYGAEMALHEALLVSPHRVTDPEEADYFFVPSYGGCFISEFNRPCVAAPRTELGSNLDRTWIELGSNLDRTCGGG